MANDIKLAKSGNPIKNGTLVVQCKVTGSTIKDFYNEYVSNSPKLSSIEDKYEERFDNPSYYYGGGGVDGGDVGGGTGDIDGGSYG